MHLFHSRVSKRQPPLMPVWVVTSQLLVLLLAACGSSGGVSPSAKPSPTASPDVVDAAILQAYQAESVAFVTAAHISDPAYPALSATATDPLLMQVRQSLVYDKDQGIVGRGDVTLEHPHVVSLSGSTAIVQDCVYSALVLVYVSSGRPVPGQPGGTQPEYDGVRATLVMTAGVWKVSDQAIVTGSCPAGY